MMSRRFALAAALVAATVAATGCGMMDNKSMMPGAMSATLVGSSEVPPTSSPGTGMAKVNLSGNSLTWTVTYSGLTGPVKAGHFHGPAAPGSNAGVVVPFTGSLESPITGSATLTDAQVADLKAGKWYFNVHTAAHPSGEIRGQLKTAP